MPEARRFVAGFDFSPSYHPKISPWISWFKGNPTISPSTGLIEVVKIGIVWVVYRGNLNTQAVLWQERIDDILIPAVPSRVGQLQRATFLLISRLGLDALGFFRLRPSPWFDFTWFISLHRQNAFGIVWSSVEREWCLVWCQGRTPMFCQRSFTC